MSITSVLRKVINKSRGASLRTILIVPFVLQICAVVGLVGYFSYRNGQKTINYVVSQLRKEITLKIEKHIENYTAKVHLINQLTVDALERRELSLDLSVRSAKTERYLWQIMQQFNNVSWLSLGSQQGEYYGIFRNDNKQFLEIVISNSATSYQNNYYALDRLGNRTGAKRVTVKSKYDPRLRPWYTEAVKAGRGIWTPIYQGFDPDKIFVSSSQPIYAPTGNLLGVIAVDVSLGNINQFLSQLEIGKTGKTFIIENSGLLVGTSTNESIFRFDKQQQKYQRLNVINSSDPLIQATAKYLKQQFSDYNNINENVRLNFKYNKKQHFVEILRYQDLSGLNWLIVVILPESDFTAQIQANNRTTLTLSTIALVIAIIFGYLTSSWIIKPILNLNNAAKSIATGKWSEKVKIERSDELGELAQSFNNMAKQLQQSFATLEVQNAQMKRLDRLKDEFLANTSHELRTPLNGIIGIAESLVDGATGTLPAQTLANLAAIAASGKRLSTLVNDILDFSQLKHKDIKLQLRAVRVREITEVVLTVSRLLIGNKNLELKNNISPDLPPVLADENRLQQILYNLVGNGIKFTDSGWVEVSAQLLSEDGETTRREDRPKSDYLAISVQDTGIGIPEDKLDRIFEFFEQADGSTARVYGGTGLGLAITKKLLELHGGTISVESTPGVGSKFTFLLPISEQSPQLAKIGSDSVSPLSIDSGGEETQSALGDLQPDTSSQFHPQFMCAISQENSSARAWQILIVDDDPVNLQVLNNYLCLCQYEITQASSGQEALALLERGFKPDLILLDVMMPRITGYEVIEKIRSQWQLDELPVVLLTAKNRISDLVTGLRMGANDYLTKPIVKDELLARIRTHLNLLQNEKLKLEKAYIREAFGRYVADEVADSLLATPEGLKLGGQRRKVTIFTSDLRGFTTLSESLSSEQVIKILNFYLERMASVITQYRGTIIEFMGDGILVVFGVPNSREDDPHRAVACGVAMQQAMVSVNEQMKKWGLPPLEMGIGIHTGEVVIGNIGSEKRTKYGVVGSQVNLTYRIESYTVGGQILISETTLKEVESLVQVLSQRQVSPKGVKKPITIYEVGGIGGKHNLYLAPEEEIFFHLPEYIPVEYSILEGKDNAERAFLGKIVKLSARGAEISCQEQNYQQIPKPLDNIKLNFLQQKSAQLRQDIYAKVLEKKAKKADFYLKFTAKPPAIHAKLNEIYQKLIF
ncbi:MAG: adenylate/guanylate cyclase domain-containing protein [Prochloraceae cyanobacterium]|nr:adenylate/guanylate cyclase domain-containing protein [Prochloraceae cyanobacterium]